MARSRKKRARGWLAQLRAQPVAFAHAARVPAAFLLLWLIGQLEPWLYLGAWVRELGFHLLLALAAYALWVLSRRAYVAAACAAAVAALLFAPLAPLYRSSKPTPTAGPLLRIATAHVADAELPRATLASWLAREQPAALALTGLAQGALRDDFDGYRSFRGVDRGSLLLTQSALTVPDKAPRQRDLVSVWLRAGRCQARLVAIELPPLLGYTTLDERARRIAAAQRVPSAPRSVWLGQLGSRSEAADLRAFFATHALRDARAGHGRLPTAPSALGPLGFPLSHVLVHGWISVRELALAPALAEGAHRPLTATLELTEPRCRSGRMMPTGNHFELKAP